LKADATIETRTVQTGLTDGTNVQVTNGLNEGEVVLIAPRTTTTSSSGNTGLGTGLGGGGFGGGNFIVRPGG